MDHLWSPWRYRYVSSASPEQRCVFCRVLEDNNDEANYIVLRAEHNYVMLNLYPYSSGHLLIAPYQHVPTLAQAPKETRLEMMELTTRAETALRLLYQPGGINLGMNLGQSAGAGVAGHIHMHVLPRWAGDANFLSTIGETRVLPEDLSTTYLRLKTELTRP